MSFCLIGAGSCRLQVSDGEPKLLREGDYVLLTAPPAWTLSKGEGAALEDFEAVYAGPDGRPALVGKENAGPLTRLLGGQFAFDTANAELLKGLLPAVVEIRSSEPPAERLRGLLDLIGNEAISDRPGRTLVLERLLEIMLVEAIRREAGHAGEVRNGLLAGLADPQLAAALRAMHAEIRRSWTVAQVATIAGMSRSVFAERFSRIVGLAPIDYLLQWRMAVAKDALRFGNSRLAEIAFDCGYKSIGAFSTAFSRTVGCPPGKYTTGFIKQQIRSGSKTVPVPPSRAPALR